MAERVAQFFVVALTLYTALGFLFAVAFVSVGAKKIDPQTIGSGIAFRLLLLPGVAAFWPLLLRRWLSGSAEAPEEENPHK
jgi:hypothetical protein